MKALWKILLAAGAMLIWSAFAVAMAFYGWWLEPVAPEGDHAAFYEWAIGEIGSRNRGNSAFVLLEDGDVVHEHFAGPDNGVDRDTLFPTASFSKWIAALSAMALVQSDALDIDAPVSRYLERWKLPESQFNNDLVTARRLLSHTAGLTDGLGFGDYQVDETVPRLETSLQNPRGSSGEDVSIAVGQKPGSFLYSGGGYLIVELVVEELTGRSYSDHVDQTVLQPARMTRSTFDFPGTLDNVSVSFSADGSTAPSYRYASQAATGFASSAADLTALVQAVVADPTALAIDTQSLRAMRQPHGYVLGAPVWGLGTILYVQTDSGDFVFGHDGANEPAINSTVRINPDSSDGVVVLVTGHPSLASAIGSEWVLWQTSYPDFLSVERALSSAIPAVVVGCLAICVLVFLWIRRPTVDGSRLNRV